MSAQTPALVHSLTDEKNETLAISTADGGPVVLATCCSNGVILDAASAINVARSLLEAAGREDLSAAVRAGLAPAAATADAAAFKVESIHHIHGHECLCGFKSAVSRDRTRHIIEALRAEMTHTPEESGL